MFGSLLLNMPRRPNLRKEQVTFTGTITYLGSNPLPALPTSDPNAASQIPLASVPASHEELANIDPKLAKAYDILYRQHPEWRDKVRSHGRLLELSNLDELEQWVEENLPEILLYLVREDLPGLEAFTETQLGVPEGSLRLLIFLLETIWQTVQETPLLLMA